jgi:hypothetical protein
MADLGNTFDPNDIPEDDRSFEPMPAGDYVCQIIDSEIVQTRSGGDMLKLTIEVIEGSFANRKVWDNMNIRNANAQAQGIAQRSLADLCTAVGAGAIRDTEELHFKPFVATLKIDPAKDGYDAKNAVKRYRARGGQAPQRPAADPATQRQAAAAAPKANGSRPWTRNAA